MKKLLFMDRKKNRKKGVEFCNVDKAKIRLQDNKVEGFLYDITNNYDDGEITTLGIEIDLSELEYINNQFSQYYNERVTEKSFATPELSKFMERNGSRG